MDSPTLAWVLCLCAGALGWAALLTGGRLRASPSLLTAEAWHTQLAARCLALPGWGLLAYALPQAVVPTGVLIAAQLLLAASYALEYGSLLQLSGVAQWRKAMIAGAAAIAAILAAHLLGTGAFAWVALATMPLFYVATVRSRWADHGVGTRALSNTLFVLIVSGIALNMRQLDAGNTVAGLNLLNFVLLALAGGAGAFVLARQNHIDELLRLATIDPLTECPNRRGFFTALNPWMSLARRPGQPTSVVLLDLDHFKRINESYGHAVGDLVLKSVVEVVRRQLRDSDLIGRLGGEEFAILLPRTGIAEAEIVAQRIQQAIASVPIKTERAVLSVTASLGLTAIAAHDSAITLFKRADSALAQAKADGRNRVGVAQAEIPA